MYSMENEKATKLLVRPATRQDVEAFAGKPNAQTVRAFVGDLDGKIIAIGGVAVVKGRHYAFLDLDEEARGYKMHIMRTALRMMQDASKRGVRFIFAEADQCEPKSDAWLKRLGFETDPRAQNLYRWKAKT